MIMTYGNRKLYRARNGRIFGICKGIANWKDLSVSAVRLICIIICIATGIFPFVVIYFLAALFIPIEPSGYRYWDDDYSGRSSRPTMDDVKREFENLKSRVSRMENEATGGSRDKESDWDRRFHDR